MRRFLWSAFVVLDILLLIVFTAGYVARWIDPRLFWWPQLGAILLPLTSILLVLFGIVPFVRKQWPLFSVHLVLIVLAASRFVSFTHLPAPSIADDQSLRVSSYNLGKLESLTQPELADKLSGLGWQCLSVGAELPAADPTEASDDSPAADPDPQAAPHTESLGPADS